MNPRVVVAGQVPPPLSGQHIAVAQLLADLRADGDFEVVHLPYRFAETMEGQGAFRLDKMLELGRILGRMVRVRRGGPIDAYIHPLGGTNTGSTVRDAVVVAMARLVSRRTVVQFHGAGHEREWRDDHRPLVRVARRSLGGADAAIVHSAWGAVDPTFLGIDEVIVAHHRIVDAFDEARVRRDGGPRLAYLGHLGPHRGTPQLLDAVARLVPHRPDLRLVLAGDPAKGYTPADLHDHIARLDLGEVVTYLGAVAGATKDDLFGTADAFVFPSVFAGESFGLVLAEALMWGLPVVATDWRGNAEILDGTDAVVHPYEPDLTAAIEAGLTEALRRFDTGEWTGWSDRNRQVFLDRFATSSGPFAAVAGLHRMLG